jgi:hypothetical protein
VVIQHQRGVEGTAYHIVKYGVCCASQQILPLDFRLGSIASPPQCDKAALVPKADLAGSICWFGSEMLLRLAELEP